VLFGIAEPAAMPAVAAAPAAIIVAAAGAATPIVTIVVVASARTAAIVAHEAPVLVARAILAAAAAATIIVFAIASALAGKPAAIIATAIVASLITCHGSLLGIAGLGPGSAEGHRRLRRKPVFGFQFAAQLRELRCKFGRVDAGLAGPDKIPPSPSSSLTWCRICSASTLTLASRNGSSRPASRSAISLGAVMLDLRLVQRVFIARGIAAGRVEHFFFQHGMQRQRVAHVLNDGVLAIVTCLFVFREKLSTRRWSCLSIATASPSDFLACAELSCAEGLAVDVRRVAVLPLGLLPDLAGAPALALVSGAAALAPGTAALAGTVPDVALPVLSGKGAVAGHWAVLLRVGGQPHRIGAASGA
jgi:hypothetical protein